MAIISFKSKKRREQEAAAKQAALGPVFLRPSEATPSSSSSSKPSLSWSSPTSAFQSSSTSTSTGQSVATAGHTTPTTGGQSVASSGGKTTISKGGSKSPVITTRQQQNLIQARQQEQLNRLRQSQFLKDTQQRALKSKATALRVYDAVSGGAITSRDLARRQEQLNLQVQDFNQRYSGELDQIQYLKAQAEQRRLSEEQKKISTAVDKFDKSAKKKIGEIVWGKYEVKLTPEQIKVSEKRVKILESQIRQREAKGLSTRFLKNQLKSAVTNLNRGSIRILGGEPGIIPAGGVGLLAKATKVRFVGTQRYGKSGEIITDIIFTTSKGQRVGVARGVTLVRGNKGFTITAGKSGKVGVNFPTGKIMSSKRVSFIGQDVSQSKKIGGLLKTQIELLNKGSKTGKTITIQKNVKNLLQGTRGSIVTIKGDKFVRGGKVLKGVNRDEFASIANILTKDDWSKIIGKTITSKGNKVNFVGFIKGEKSASSLMSGTNQIQKTQYKLAMKKVLGQVSSALSKTKKVPGLTKQAQIAKAALILKTPSLTSQILASSRSSQSLISPRLSPPQVSTVPTVSTTPPILQVKKVKSALPSKVRSRVNSQNIQQNINLLNTASTSIQREVTNTKQQLKQKLANKTKQELKNKISQAQKTQQKIMQAQRSLQKLKTTLTSRTPLLSIKVFPGRGLFWKPKKKIETQLRTVKSPVKIYSVQAKVRGKNLNIKSNLTEKDAKDFLAYYLDFFPSRSAVVKLQGKSKRVVKIPQNMKGYFNRNKIKFRPYKIIRKGKKPIKGHIEKRKYTFDKPTERRTTIKRTIKRKITPSQRKVLLERLKKARAVRMRNLRKRK